MKPLLATVGLLIGVGTSACDLYESSSAPGSQDGCEVVQLTSVTTANQNQCPCGGTLISTGNDLNCDGILEASEVIDSFTACVMSDTCGGGPSSVPLTSSTTLPVGDAHCPYGGTEIDIGVDTNDDDILETSEITSRSYLCNPACSVNQLLTTTALPLGDAHCPCGGTRVEAGLDNGDGGGTACDGVLQPGEVTATSYVCPTDNSGDCSMPGPPPSLLATTSLPVGDANCPYGGTEIETGVDNGAGGGIAGDGILQPGEVNTVQYICSPAPTDGGQPIVIDAGVTDAQSIDAPTAPIDGGVTIAQGSPWPMYQAGPSLQGRSSAVGPRNPIVEWIVEGDFDQPSIAADGTLYVHNLETESVEAILPDGTVSWIFNSDAGGIIVGTPAILSDGTIVIGTTKDVRTTGLNVVGTLYALTPAGTVAWSLALDGGTLTSPTVGPDGTIYVISVSYLDVGPTGELSYQLQAVHPNGTNAWTSASWIGASDVKLADMPAIGSDGTIYLNMTCGLVAFAPDGVQKWIYNDPSGACVAAPSIGDDGTIYAIATSYSDNVVVALDPQGTQVWEFDLGDNLVEGLGIGPDGTIFANGSSGVVAISPSGSQDWTANYGIGYSGWPSIVDAAGRVYFSEPIEAFGCLTCVTTYNGTSGLQTLAPDGSRIWALQQTFNFNAAAIGADGTLYTSGNGAFGTNDPATRGLYAIGESTNYTN